MNTIPNDNYYEVNAGQLKTVLLADAVSYLQYSLSCMSHEDDILPTPEFHINLFDKFTDWAIKRVGAACPRGHAKTTIVKSALSRIIYTSKTSLNIAYLSHSAPLAAKALLDTKHLLTHPNMMQLFGVPQFTTEQHDRGVYRFILNGRIFNMMSFGANSQIRGTNIDNRRIDVLVVDDLEDMQENNSDILFDKLKKWFYSDVMKALSKNAKVIMIGNIVNTNSLVEEICNDPRWDSIKLSAIKADGTPLWGELNSFEDLIAEYNSYVKKGLGGQWCAEMLNDPRASNSLAIDLGKIGRKPNKDPLSSEHKYGYITIDPAISSESWGHAQTMSVHCYYESPVPHWQIVDQRVAYGQSPVVLYHEMHKLLSLWNISVVGIEAEAFQAALKPIYEYLDGMNERAGLVEYIQLKTMKKSKASRIQSFVDLLYQGVYYLSDKDNLAITQLLAFDPTSKKNQDDLIDVYAYAPQMLNLHMEKIRKQKRYEDYRANGANTALLDKLSNLNNLT